MLIGIVLINVAGVKYFGEFEFWFAALKIVTLVGLIILGLVVDLGGAPRPRSSRFPLLEGGAFQ